MNNLNRIVFATDFSGCADHAMPLALELTRRNEAELDILHVITQFEGDPYSPLFYAPEAMVMQQRSKLTRQEHLEKRIREMLESTLRGKSVEGLKIRLVKERHATASSGILNHARDRKADLIIMGTHGRKGFSHFMVGSVAEQVMRHAECPILTVRESEKEETLHARIKRIFVPVDFSKSSAEAIRVGEQMAHLFEAELHLLNVIEPLNYPAHLTGLATIQDVVPDMKERTYQHMERLMTTTFTLGISAEIHVDYGPPVTTILNHVRDHEADLVVMGTVGRTGLSRFFMGSVAERVVRAAPCPVITVRADGHGTEHNNHEHAELPEVG